MRHSIAEPGDLFREYQLLGAADICGRRYARLAKPRMFGASSVTCVPWIDAFTERIGQTVSVQWVKRDDILRVTNADGNLFGVSVNSHRDSTET